MALTALIRRISWAGLWPYIRYIYMRKRRGLLQPESTKYLYDVFLWLCHQSVFVIKKNQESEGVISNSNTVSSYLDALLIRKVHTPPPQSHILSSVTGTTYFPRQHHLVCVCAAYKLSQHILFFRQYILVVLKESCQIRPIQPPTAHLVCNQQLHGLRIAPTGQFLQKNAPKIAVLWKGLQMVHYSWEY